MNNKNSDSVEQFALGSIEYHIEKTAWAFNTDLSVFPLSDCYSTREEADSALEKELNE